MSDEVDSSELLLSCMTKASEPSVHYGAENPIAGYDADDEADLLSHVSETSSFSHPDSDAESDISSPAVVDELQPISPVEDEGLGDSASNPPVEPTEPVAVLAVVPSEPLAEGDSGSSTSSPARTDNDDSAGPSNLRRRRVLVESESAKRARMEL